MHAGPHHCVRTRWEGPTGAGGHRFVACDMTPGGGGVQPLCNSVQVPYTTCSHCEDEVREGSVQSNHSELTSKTSTHLSFSALKWFKEVRWG